MMINVKFPGGAFGRGLRAVLGLVSAGIVSACVSFPPAPEPTAPVVISANRLQSVDGALLGLRSWKAEEPTAIILAVHGMNDYGHAFDGPARWWAEHSDITTYAIDQRGHGHSPNFGRWAGAPTMKADIRAAVDALKHQHPTTPLFVLGHSMGAGAVMAGEADASFGADGLILAAPGVWGGAALPIPYRVAAELSGVFAPGKTLTGERAERQSTDNIEILRAMYYDPLVIKDTRIDAVIGVTRLMGEAYRAPQKINTKALILIGEKDEIIPLKLQREVSENFAGDAQVITYPDGWHMIFRDLQAEKVWRDVAEWTAAQSER